jgi:hypothetical protein
MGFLMPPYNENPCLYGLGSSADVYCLSKGNKKKEIGGHPK